MILIWRGKGLIIGAITFACSLGGEVLSSTVSGDDRYYETHGWPLLVALWTSAALIYAMRSWLGVGSRRVLVDPRTNASVVLNSEASLFFVPARHWPVILVVLGAAISSAISLAKLFGK